VNREKIFIGVPTFNREDSILDCLNSLQRQSFKDFKVLISDNSSSDSTKDLIRSFCEENTNFDYIIQDENIGWYRNFQYLLECGKEHEYFMWAPSDDTWSENFLSDCVKILEHSKDVAVVQASTYLISPNNKIQNERNVLTKIDFSRNLESTSRYKLVRLILSRGYAFFIMGLFRTSVLRSVFLNFPQVPSADRYFLLQLPLRGWKMATTNKSFYYRAIHEVLAPDRYPDDLYLQNTKKSSKKLFDYSSFQGLRSMIFKSRGKSLLFSYYIFIMFFISRTKIGVLNTAKYLLSFLGKRVYKKVESVYKKIT